jgi:hypothetical protein
MLLGKFWRLIRFEAGTYWSRDLLWLGRFFSLGQIYIFLYLERYVAGVVGMLFLGCFVAECLVFRMFFFGDVFYFGVPCWRYTEAMLALNVEKICGRDA